MNERQDGGAEGALGRVQGRFGCERWLVLLACALASQQALAQVQAGLPVVELSIGMHRIEAELADTPQRRQVGLMNRTSMAPQRGMVFVFTQDARHCMWMKNTLLPLSVAFVDADGEILNVADMTPHSEQSHCAAGAARFALEMNQGWFAQRGIEPGVTIRGLARLPPPR